MNVFAEITDRQQLRANVVSLGERRLLSPSETVRKLLEDDQKIRTALIKECPYATVHEIKQACDKAFSAYHRGESIETCTKIGAAVAETLAAERTFGDGPRAA